jgi:hypothetical protein
MSSCNGHSLLMRNNTRCPVALSLAVLIGLICSTRASAEDRCGGVLMATRTTVMKDRKEMVQKLGFYAIDGGLVMDGKSTCTSIRIECSKEARTCRTATATTAFMGQPQVIGVMMSDDYRVTEWTRDTISAEMHTRAGPRICTSRSMMVLPTKPR